MPFGQSVDCVCAECGLTFPHAKRLSNHLKKTHKVSPIDYMVKHLHEGTRPLCLTCGEETRYVSLTQGFKTYCKEHSSVAESLAGKVGGRTKRTWNKRETKEMNAKVAEMSLNQTGEGNPFYGKTHTEKAKETNAEKHRLSFTEVTTRINELQLGVTVESTTYVNQNEPLSLRCNACLTESAVSLFNIERCWRCHVCHPIGSRQQLEMFEFVRSLGFTDVVSSTRSVIAPLEIDVWVPSKNVAIEYHGLYWHSGGKSGVFDKTKHIQKHLACKKSGIRLVQFFSDEWLNKGPICRSMIANALGANSLKLNARDCEVKTITSSQSKQFVDANHISGGTKAKHHIGLFHRVHGLVGVATTRTPIQKKWGHVCELARMCFLAGASVRGGASKLLAVVERLAQDDGFQGLLSYADLRFGEGKVYELCGFPLVDTALNNYWYTDGLVRYNRFKFRAQPGVTEKQVAELNKVRPVWGVGNKVYLKRFGVVTSCAPASVDFVA